MGTIKVIPRTRIAAAMQEFMKQVICVIIRPRWQRSEDKADAADSEAEV